MEHHVFQLGLQFEGGEVVNLTSRQGFREHSQPGQLFPTVLKPPPACTLTTQTPRTLARSPAWLNACGSAMNQKSFFYGGLIRLCQRFKTLAQSKEKPPHCCRMWTHGTHFNDCRLFGFIFRSQPSRTYPKPLRDIYCAVSNKCTRLAGVPLLGDFQSLKVAKKTSQRRNEKLKDVKETEGGPKHLHFMMTLNNTLTFIALTFGR